MKFLQTWVVYSQDPYDPTKLNRLHRYEEYTDNDIPQGIIDGQLAVRKKAWDQSMKEGNCSAFKLCMYVIDSETMIPVPVTAIYEKSAPVKQKKILNEQGQAEKQFAPSKKVFAAMPVNLSWEELANWNTTTQTLTSVATAATPSATTNNPVADWI